MPIFDIQARAEATFPKLGTIRKGAKKGQNKPGQDLTHFRLDDAKEVAEAYQALYGTTEPREMGIFLPFDDIDRVFRAFHELYSAGTLLCQGDGKQVQYMRHPQTGQLLARGGYAVVDFQVGQAKFTIGEAIPCPGMAHGLYPHCAKCRPHGYLMAIIPEVKRFGYYEFKTTSFYDILNLTGNLRAIMALNNGRLTGVPLVVRRAPQQISTPTPEGKRVRREKWLLSIEAAPGWVDMMQRRWNALEAGDAPLALLASGHEDADEDDENGGFVEEMAIETEAIPTATTIDVDAATGEIVPPKPLTETVAKPLTEPKAVAKPLAEPPVPKLDRPGALRRVNQLQAKVYELTGDFSAPHLRNHLLKHYGVESLSKLTDEQIIAFGQHLRQLVVDAEAKLAANSAPAEDSHQADVAGAAEGV